MMIATLTKPVAILSGTNGNIINITSIAARALRNAGLHEKADELIDKVFDEAQSYEEAVDFIMDFVQVK
jgi:hypothetical protein